jgi:hypothetical protein
MMRYRGLFSVGLFLCCLVVAPFATAQDDAASAVAKKEFPPEVAKLLAKVQPQVYSPYTEGLKGISFEIYMPMMEAMGMGNVKFLYAWKSGEPEQSTFKIEGELPSPDMKEMMQGQMESQAKSLADLMIVKPYLDKYKGHDVSLTQDGDLQKLSVTALTKDAGFKRQVLWIDKQFLPVKAETEMENPMMGQTVTETSTFNYEMKGNRRVIKSISAEASMGNQEIKFEYADVGAYTLLSKMTIESPMNPMGPMTIEFRNVAVDENLDDSLFSGE